MAEPGAVVTPQRPGTGSPGLLAFFGLTLLVTESCFIAAAVLSRRVAPGEDPGFGPGALVRLGTFAPALVALALTVRAGGGPAVRALLEPLFRWRVRARWYVFAIGYMAAIKLTAALVHRLVLGAWPRFGDDAWYLLLAAAVFSTVSGGQVGEELGWRGYALPRLAARFGLGGASVVLGVIWAVWHLPLFWFQGADTNGQSFGVYLLQVVALSVAIAWLYRRTDGSLLLTMLLHAAINNTKDIVPSVPRAPADPFVLQASSLSWITAALLWVAAGYLLVRMRRASDEATAVPLRR